MSRAELELLRDGVVVRVIRLLGAVSRIGRHPDNDVVLLDPFVSGTHAVIVRGAKGLVVRDLGSRNGTWINDVRVTAETAITEGDEVRLGDTAILRVRSVEAIPPQGLCVIDVRAGTMLPIQTDRVTFGSLTGCTIVIAGARPIEATVEYDADGALWLVRPEGATRLQPGDTFEVAACTFRLDPADMNAGTTLPILGKVAYQYELVTSLDAPGGPYARLYDPASGVARVIGAENRATVLFVLARRRLADLEAGVREEAGWMDDDEVMVAIWGRQAHQRAPSTYAVLVHRIRRELLEAGFDPGLFERRRGACRLRLDRIRIVVQPD